MTEVDWNLSQQKNCKMFFDLMNIWILYTVFVVEK